MTESTTAEAPITDPVPNSTPEPAVAAPVAPPAVSSPSPRESRPMPDPIAPDTATSGHFLGQIQKLSGEAKKYRLKARGFRDENAALRQQVAELQAALQEIGEGFDALEAEHGELQARFEASPDEAMSEIASLRSQLLERDHRDAFRGLYDEDLDESGARLNKQIPVEKLWSLIGYQPEGDPDLDAIKERLRGARTSDPYLFQAKAADPSANATVPDGTRPGATAPTTTQRRQPVPPGPGVSRGTTNAEQGLFVVTQAQMADPTWMYNNQGKVQEAMKAGTFRLNED